MGGYIAGGTLNTSLSTTEGEAGGEGGGGREAPGSLPQWPRLHYIAGNIDQGSAALELPCDRVRKCLVGQWFAHTMHIAGASARLAQS